MCKKKIPLVPRIFSALSQHGLAMEIPTVVYMWSSIKCVCVVFVCVLCIIGGSFFQRVFQGRKIVIFCHVLISRFLPANSSLSFTSQSRMNALLNGDNLFLLPPIILGLVQSACGILILVPPIANYGYNPLALLLTVAAGFSFISAGVSSFAIVFVRGNVFKIALAVTSFLSMIFGVSPVLNLILSSDDQDSEAQVTAMVIGFGSSFSALFQFVFFSFCCCASKPGAVHSEDRMESPPVRSPPPSYSFYISTPRAAHLPPSYDSWNTSASGARETENPPPEYHSFAMDLEEGRESHPPSYNHDMVETRVLEI